MVFTWYLVEISLSKHTDVIGQGYASNAVMYLTILTDNISPWNELSIDTHSNSHLNSREKVALKLIHGMNRYQFQNSFFFKPISTPSYQNKEISATQVSAVSILVSSVLHIPEYHLPEHWPLRQSSGWWWSWRGARRDLGGGQLVFSSLKFL